MNKPFFKYPQTDSNIFMFSDASHLLKQVWNWLLDTGFVLNGGQKITKEPVQALTDLTNQEVNPCWKITQHHLDCEKSHRQNVRVVVQLFSNSVSTSLSRYKPGNDKQNCDTLATFIVDINIWFDIFNSYVENGPVPPKCAYGDRHLKIQDVHLDKMIMNMF